MTWGTTTQNGDPAIHQEVERAEAPAADHVLERLAPRPPLDHGVEALAVHEMVLAPVLLAGARLAGGGGDGELELRHALSQGADEGALAHA